MFQEGSCDTGGGRNIFKESRTDFLFFLKLLLENTGKDAKEEEEGR